MTALGLQVLVLFDAADHRGHSFAADANAERSREDFLALWRSKVGVNVDVPLCQGVPELICPFSHWSAF